MTQPDLKELEEALSSELSLERQRAHTIMIEVLQKPLISE
jgi:hypothetical protein